MTTTHRPNNDVKSSSINAIIDKLRSCSSSEEILEFERWFNSRLRIGPLHLFISRLLKNKSISRVTASKWFETLLEDKEDRLNKLSH